MLIIILLAISYALGSLSTALIVSNIANLTDPREEGSRNAGATNMLRTAGKKIAAIVLIGDMGKGVVATVIGIIAGQSGFTLGLVMIAVVVGHIYPVFFKFKGGKGVATALGAILASQPLIGLACLVIWIIIAFATRYASLASMLAIAAAPVIDIFTGHSGLIIPGIIIAILIAVKHKENIKRLKSGVENKIKFKGNKQSKK